MGPNCNSLSRFLENSIKSIIENRGKWQPLNIVRFFLTTISHRYGTIKPPCGAAINWPNFIVWLPLLLKILGNMCITIVCEPGCDVINFEINLVLLIKPFCYTTWKVKTRSKISWERKELLRWNKKHFSSLLKGFQLPKVVSDLREHL